MNKPFSIKIESILGGHSPTTHFASTGQFRASIGIDPAQPLDDNDTAYSTIASGIIRPTASEVISTISSAPLWMITNPKDANVYVTDANGSTYTINETFSVITGLADGGTLTNGHGNGSEYYDNYIYIGKNTTVARYGPLNGVPAFNGDYWVTTLAKTALENTTYPVSYLNKLQYPNHVLHRHSNGKLYIADVVGNTGTIHYISTTKTTVEGDTDNSSTYDALHVGYGLWPTAIESYGEELAIAFYEGSIGNLRQARAKLAFWDTTSTNVNKLVWVEFPDQIITAMKNVNGVLYVVSGNINAQGFRVTRFLGGYSFDEVFYSETGEPCLQGAIDAVLNRCVFGTWTNVPETAGVAFGIGLQKEALGSGIFSVMRATGSTTTTGAVSVTSLAVADNSGMGFLTPIIGWTQANDGSGSASHGIDKQGTEYGNAPSVFWSQLYRLGKNFKITEIIIPLTTSIATGMIITPKIYFDNGETSQTLVTINNTNYPSQKLIHIKPEGATGKHNFWFELRFTGSSLSSVDLPVTIKGEYIDF